jgi:signal transduction histidine kinase
MFAQQSSDTSGTSRPTRYGVAVLGVGIAFVVSAALAPLVGPAAPFVPMTAAVAAAAWYGGTGPGLFATLAAAALGALAAAPAEPGCDLILPAGAFLLQGAFVSWLAGRRPHSRQVVSVLPSAADPPADSRDTVASIDLTVVPDVAEAVAAERHWIGRELHDGVGQELTGLGLLADTLARRLGPHAAEDARLAAAIGKGLDRARGQLRAVARRLVPDATDPAGLPAALEDLAARTREQAGIDCTFAGTGPVRVPDAAAATHLLRIAQEAVGNALRHGRPRRIAIALSAEGGSIRLSVRDDGAGVPDRVPEGAGLGLRLMRFRAGAMGGAVAVGPAAGGGTVVDCTIPGGSDDDSA